MTLFNVAVNVVKEVVNSAQITCKKRWKFLKGPDCSFPLKEKICLGSQYLQDSPQVKYYIPLSEGTAVLQVLALSFHRSLWNPSKILEELYVFLLLVYSYLETPLKVPAVHYRYLHNCMPLKTSQCRKDIKGKKNTSYGNFTGHYPLCTRNKVKHSIFPLKPYSNDKSLAKYRLIWGDNLDFEKLYLITYTNLVHLAHHSVLRFSLLSWI